jgi:hypothetical protein
LCLIRLRGGERCLLLALRQDRDDLSLADIAAVFEVQMVDALGDRRGERHLLVRARRAHRFDPVDEDVRSR